MLTVEAVMSSPPITCHPDDSLEYAARLLWDHDCGAVIVTSPEGQLVGIITDRDICMAAYTRGGPIREIRVADVMAKRVFYCQAAAPVRWALLLMGHYQVRRLPVVGKHQHPIGLVSLNNLIRYSAWGDEQLRRELLETLGQISLPRALEAEQPPRPRSGIFEKPCSPHAIDATAEHVP